jgi:hypothetical protein
MSQLFVVSTAAKDLVEVEVETTQGSKYVFPDMSLENMKKVLPSSGRIPESVTFLMFYNYSGSVLSIPFRIVKEVRVGGTILWKSPA